MLGLILLAQTLTVAIAGPATSPEYLPVRLAQIGGHFAREGLTVVLRTTRAEPGAAEALAQGQADLAATSLDAMLRFGPRSAGQAPRLVFGLSAAPPVALVVPTSQQEIVRLVTDLRGTRIGLASPGAPEQAWLGWLLARAGLTLAHVAVVSHGSRGLVAAVESGELHAGLVPEPHASQLIAGNRVRLLVDLRTPAAVARALGTPTVNAAVFMRADRRPRDRDLAAFARALLAAEGELANLPPEDVAAKITGRPVEIGDEFAARIEATRAMYLPGGLVDDEQVKQTITLIRSHKPLPITSRIPTADELLHVDPLRRLSPAAAR
jgi:ABC-type nitrate/sulfonate/bicarbonate transport system substrate-binding protein